MRTVTLDRETRSVRCSCGRTIDHRGLPTIKEAVMQHHREHEDEWKAEASEMLTAIIWSHADPDTQIIHDPGGLLARLMEWGQIQRDHERGE